MKKKNKTRFLESLGMLFFIIIGLAAIYYGTAYLINDINHDSSESKITSVDIYVAGTKVTETQHTYLLADVNDFVNVEFKEKNTNRYYDQTIIASPNYDASTDLIIEDAFDSGKFTNTKITLKKRTLNSRITFTDSENTFEFRLYIKSEFTNATEVSVPDIIFYQ